MSGIPHAGMSGGGPPSDAGQAGTAPGQSDSGRNPGAGERGDDRGSRGSHRKAGASGSGAADAGRRGGDRPATFRDAGLSPTSLAINEAAIQGVTTAFLDAYVKEDAIAREWLDRNASRWLRDRGEIKRK
jgi:hypothetical protein